MRHPVNALALLILACAPAVIAQRDQSQSDAVRVILSGLAQRTQEYYDRFVSIICTETVEQQDLKVNLAPSGNPRRTVYELSVSRHPERKEEEFVVGRLLQSINGKPVREPQEPGCTDPQTGTPEPLGFLLAANQAGFRFWVDDRAVGGPDGSRALDFVQTPPERVRIKWTDNCFQAEGGEQEGRIWFDPDNFDVLQVDARLSKPFVVPAPGGLHSVRPTIRVERSEVTMRFSRVRFERPDESVLLLNSIETLTVFRGARSLRTLQTLTDFRRFLSESTIRDPISQARFSNGDGNSLAFGTAP